MPRHLRQKEAILVGVMVLGGLLAIAGGLSWRKEDRNYSNGDEERRRRSTVFTRYGGDVFDDQDVTFEDDSDSGSSDDADTVVDENHLPSGG